MWGVLMVVAPGAARVAGGRGGRFALGSVASTVRNRRIETGISEASKRVSIFSFATQGGKQVSFSIWAQETAT